MNLSIIVWQASCTLEAGVKIYALRVDSVHSEAYKVLGGISRAGLEEQQGLSFMSMLIHCKIESIMQNNPGHNELYF